MSASPMTYAIEYPGGVVAIDSGFNRDRMATCYLLEQGGEIAVIETGTNASVPRILEVLERRGHAPEAVRWVIATHVHLDHAGGAGRLMQACPRARFGVHPRGARHMIDPSKLEASVRMVYGDEVYEATYGELLPIAPGRLREIGDGERVELGGRALLFRDTPGHARHHFCIWDEATRGWFSGDTFGLSYRETDTRRGAFIFPTTTPVQFDPPALRTSIGLLMEARPEWMYLTHFGRVGETERLAADLLAAVDALVELAERHADSPARRHDLEAEMMAWLIGKAREHGCTQPQAELEALFNTDVELNTQGIEFWLDHRE